MRKKILFISLLAVIILPGYARAYGDAAVILPALAAAKDYLLDNASQIGNAITGKITTMQSDIARVVAGAADISTKAQIDAAGKIADDAYQKQIGLRNAEDVARAGQRYQLAPSTCEEGSRAGTTIAARGAKEYASKNAELQATARNLLTESPAAAAQQGFMDHVKKYCGPADAALKRCAPTELPDGDISATAFLSGAGAATKSADATFSPHQIEAARAYKDRIINPLPAGNLPPEAEKTAAGRAYLAMRLDEEAKLSLAGKPFGDSLAMRSPSLRITAADQDAITKIISSGASLPADIQSSITKDGRISPLATLQLQIDSRTGRPNWYSEEVAGASPEAALRELVHIAAAQLQMNMFILEHLEKNGLLQGAQYAELIKGGNGGAKLVAQQKEALKAIGR